MKWSGAIKWQNNIPDCYLSLMNVRVFMLFCPTPAHFTAPDFNPKPPPGGYIILSKLILQTPAASLAAPTDNITTKNVSFFLFSVVLLPKHNSFPP